MPSDTPHPGPRDDDTQEPIEDPDRWSASSNPPTPGQRSYERSRVVTNSNRRNSIDTLGMPLDLSAQDSENNNVDENSNDQQYEQFRDYHDQFPNHQYAFQGESVRSSTPDETDRSQLPSIFNVSSSSSHRERSGSFHRRNLSDTSVRPRIPQNNYPVLPSGPARDSNTQRRISGRFECSSTFQENQTSREAQFLLRNFTRETLIDRNIDISQDILPVQSVDESPSLINVGIGLRTIADDFAKSAERRRVKKMAEEYSCVSLLNKEEFFTMCSGLFSGGITRERIVALFLFIVDIAALRIRSYAASFVKELMDWSLQYIVEHICQWVEDAGGWGAVFIRGGNIIYKATITFAAIVVIAAGTLYIWKNI